MKKLLIISLLFSCCTIHKQYSPQKLKYMSEDMLKTREMLQYDYDNGKIERGTAQIYYNLLETYAFNLDKEYNKAKAKRNGKTVYKLISINKR
tara:strand:- start:144 stop:422 length:279 start_codon:yes stop_codon:yes gene_type:complete